MNETHEINKTIKADTLTIALPKGKLGTDAIELLQKAGYPVESLETDSRKLFFAYPEENVNYIICRPTDVPTYVDYGAADLGIVGKDSLVESNKDVFELVDLKFGACRFVVAIPKKRAEELADEQGHVSLSHFNHTRVATKFPRVADVFLRDQGVQVEVIKLHGNIELAPKVNLSEMIVDIVSSGATLKENDLVPIAEIFSASARLIANRVSYRIKHERMQELIEKMRALTKEETESGDQNNRC
ncbi:ATP phosphoribosyltransferase [Dehalobacterium formicoaceticum]|uniref:ATP phosphoribosyltransferase n=1 Tax=Dehalobacterium formicoaceticum TaxID=51515 RepID=UPI0023EE75C2|nr:ATP phosphoribosyltransferase [Dehalobacterium formicoaceticum]